MGEAAKRPAFFNGGMNQDLGHFNCHEVDIMRQIHATDASAPLPAQKHVESLLLNVLRGRIDFVPDPVFQWGLCAQDLPYMESLMVACSFPPGVA